MAGLVAVILIAWVASAGGGGALDSGRLIEDPPSVPVPVAGDVTGVVVPASKVAKLTAVSRVTGKRYEPAAFDRQSGRFRFAALAGDASYDVCIVTGDGRRIEGIDLSWFEARAQRLAAIRRKQLGLPDPPRHVFSAADADELRRFIANRKDFSGTNRPLAIGGLGPQAVMLVERVRTTPFHGGAKNERIWRTDLFYFTYDAGGWQMLPNARRLVERAHFTPAAWKKFSIRYDPALSVYVAPDGKAKPLRYTIAEKPVAPTEPILMGVPPAATP